MNTFIIITSGLLGYALAAFFAGKKTGEPGRMESLIFRLGNIHVHLHHWLLAAIILGLMVVFNAISIFIFAFLSGIILQGLFYRDFYKIIYRVPVHRVPAQKKIPTNNKAPTQTKK